MLDPVPQPADWLFKFTKPYAEAVELPTLPYHIHEVIFAYLLYQNIELIVSPRLSTWLFPDVYPKLNRRTRINWDVHAVSLVQSLLINTLALWVMFTDEERRDMKHSAIERIHGYTGASGLIQAFAAGYFLWDFIVSTRHIKIFGLGIWFHAVSALVVFGFGFVSASLVSSTITLTLPQRPFVNYYGPVFILYELSTPFLNVHWFCDKLNMTGGRLQWYNGITLLATFFGSRLVWGTYQSVCVFRDVWAILQMNSVPASRDLHSSTANSIFVPRDGQLCAGKQSCVEAQSEVMKFAHNQAIIPMWLALTYLGSNLILHSLNFYWFGRMIETVRKRFEGAPHDEFKHERERRQSIVEELATGLDENEISGPKTPMLEKSQNSAMKKSDDTATSTAVQDGGADIGKRRKDL